jgi:hypothetical protein
MGAIKWLLPFLVVLMSYVLYCLSWTFDFRKEVQFKGESQCALKQAPSFSQFIQVGDALLASSADEGAIFHVVEDPFTTTKILLENWPGTPFKPKGMALYGDSGLYVVNAARYTVEVFVVTPSQTEVRLLYEHTFLLSGDFSGSVPITPEQAQFHSIIVFSKDELYVTLAQSSSSSPGDLVSTVTTAARLAFSKSSSLQRCTRLDLKFMCESVWWGYHFQGMVLEDSYILIADSAKKEILRLKRKKDGTVRERNRISVAFSPVQLLMSHGVVYAVGHADFYEAFTYNPTAGTKVSGVVAEVKKSRRDWVAVDLVVERLSSGACSIFKTKKRVLVGHCLEASVLDCSL